MDDIIYGSFNKRNNSSGGDNTINNSGTVNRYICGSYNEGQASNGSGNNINNSGTVTNRVYGSYNWFDASGGENTITNSGTVGYIDGTWNVGGSTSGSGNTIRNSGRVAHDIFGTCNDGGGSSGGGNIIYNSGTVNQDIYGTYNFGDSSSGGGNYINNSGTVGGSIYGTVNVGAGSTATGNTIVNSGTVGGGIYAGDGDDSVTITGNSNVAGDIDGQAGTDTLTFGATGTHDSAKYINFEHAVYKGTGITTLIGNWNFDLGATVSGGSLTVASGAAMSSSILNISSGASANINGTASAYTANSGTLLVNGNLFGDVQNSGTIGGSGQIYGNVSNTGGCLAPGNSIGTITVIGTYTHSAGSEYQCELSTDGSCDMLHATSIILQGGMVTVALPKGFYTSDMSWIILTSDQDITGEFSSLTNSDIAGSSVLSLGLQYGAKEVSVVLARKSYAAFGANANQRNVGRAFDDIVPLAQANGDSMAALLNIMDWQYNGDQIRDVLAACNPEMYDGMSWAALQNARFFDGVMQNRADWGRTAGKLDTDLGSKGGPVRLAAEETGKNVAAEPMQNDWSLWARALGSWNRRSGNAENLGYDSSTGGAVLGADGPVLPCLRLGVAFAAGNTDVSFSSTADAGTQKSVQGGLYATADLGDFYLDATLSFSSFDNDTERGVAFNDVGATAKASYDASAWLGSVGGGWDYQCGNWVLGPRLGINYLSLSEDSLRESGADFLDLSIQDRETDYWSSALGFRVAARYDLGSWALLPRLNLAWQHMFSDDARSIEASFRDYTGQSFTVYGMEPVQDALQMQAGVRAVLTQRANAFLQYGVALGDDMSSQDISLGFNYSF